MRFTVLATFAVALLVSAPAHADLTDDWQARAGIERAKAAGIKVDPAAEALMERAPAESCFGDPARDGCPRVKAVRIAGEGYADDAAATSARRRPSARAAIDQCRLRVTDQSPYKSAGYAQMDGQNYCSTAVSRFESYAVLRKYYAGQWYAMNSHYKVGTPGKTTYISVRYYCTATPYRAWEARLDGYALLQGVWYGATQSKYNNLYCG